jgi:hypothetical protein
MRRAILLLVGLALPQVVCGQQPRLSEKATVSQEINGTTITIEYYRPVAWPGEPVRKCRALG